MNTRSNSAHVTNLAHHLPQDGTDTPSASAIAGRRHTAVGVTAADAAAAGFGQTRWLTIDHRLVPIAAQLQRPVQPQPIVPPGCRIDAEQLARALHRQARDLVGAYTQRFARDIGYELSALHNGQRRAYLDVTPGGVQFIAPATFCLAYAAPERTWPTTRHSPVMFPGTLGFSPEDQLLGMASWDHAAVVAIDSFSWAASVCAFALGEPLAPVWRADDAPKAWVSTIFAMLDVNADEIKSAADKIFFAHWALDHACSLVVEAHAEQLRFDAAGAAGGTGDAVAAWGSPTRLTFAGDDNAYGDAPGPLRDTLHTLGAPWPALPERLGPLFPAILSYFDLQWTERPRIETLLSELEVRRL